MNKSNPVKDIALKETLNRLKNENTILRRIIDDIPCSIYWKDINGVYLGRNDFSANKMIEQRFENEYDKDIIVGKTDHDIFPKKVADKFREHDLKVMQSGEDEVLEETFIGSDSKVYHHISTKRPLYDEEGKLIGIVGYTFDVTAEKEVERLGLERERAEKKAAHFRIAAGTIAHDLKTSLATFNLFFSNVKFFIEALTESYHLAKESGLPVKIINDKQLKDLGQIIEANCQEVYFANSLINLILNNLKHENINTQTYKILDAADIIENAINTYPFKRNEKKLLHYNFDFRFKFYGNEIYLKNIINNLIKNALFFIKEVDRGEIFLWTEVNETSNLVHFKDTAKGASEEIIKHMFDGYYSKRQGGSGLGLVFCKAVMQSFGGDIIADSIEDQYMHLTLIFPKIEI